MAKIVKFELLALFVLFAMVGDWNVLHGMSRVIHDLMRDGGATAMTLGLMGMMVATLALVCDD